MQLPDYLIVAFYLIGLLFLGYRLRTSAGQQDYFLANRSLGWQPLALSVMATQLSAVSFVSAPAFVGLREGGGLVWLSYELALPLAMLFLLWRLMPTIYDAGVLSVYDYIEQRFSTSTRLLVSLVFQISRSFATGIMIYAIAVILQGAIGLPFWACVTCIGVITMVYSLLGGMRAVVYGDALQMLLIVTGAITCLIFGIVHLGGIEEALQLVQSERLTAVKYDSFGLNGEGFGFWPMLFGGFILYVSYYGCDQSEAQRALSAKNLTELKKVYIAVAFCRFPIACIYCGAGLVIGALALKDTNFMAQIPAQKPDWMMPIFIVDYLPAGITGLLLVAIMAAAMSSLSSAINSLSVVSVEDYCRYRGVELSDADFVKAGRCTGLIWGILTLLLSFFAGEIASTVIEAINKMGSLFYGPILATFLLAIFTSGIKAKVMNLGLLSGVLCNLTLWIFAPQVFWFWWNITGCLMTLVVSLFFSDRGQLRKISLNSVIFANLLTRKDIIAVILWFLAILLLCSLIPFIFS